MLRRYALIPIMVCLLMTMSACNLGASDPMPAPPTAQGDDERLTVAWVDAGNLIVWHDGDTIGRRIASGAVIHPFISPDGEHIAFTRGPAGVAESLWVVDVEGTAERQLVGGDGTPAFSRGTNLIGDVQWFDERIIYFNTLTRQLPAPTPRDDLYRANIHTREVSLIRPRGQGGAFHFSPDRQWIAVVSAGTYGRQDGAIRVFDLLAQRPTRNLLFYIGVASGGHAPFYPHLQWTPDSSAVLTAIPDKDLLYSDTAESNAVPLTRLWRLPIDTPANRSQLGSVRASFFGLPRWSEDTTHMTYLERQPASNDFAIMVADMNGDGAAAHIMGGAGSLNAPQWLPRVSAFLYSVDGKHFIATYEPGMSSEASLLSSEVIYAPQFLTATQYIFLTPEAVANDGFQFRIAQMGELSRFIIHAGRNVPIYDALFITQSGDMTP